MLAIKLTYQFDLSRGATRDIVDKFIDEVLSDSPGVLAVWFLQMLRAVKQERPEFRLEIILTGEGVQSVPSAIENNIQKYMENMVKTLHSYAFDDDETEEDNHV